ncbi:MAG: hypothetical protein QXG00_04745 [Candidatus Woesearchaeota archaeon]
MKNTHKKHHKTTLQNTKLHEDHEYIERLFYEQIKKQSIATPKIFDFQFSGDWM